MAKGFMYLVAIMDWASRKVLSWRLSNTLDSRFCVEALEEALPKYSTATKDASSPARPTSLLKQWQVRISMDGTGRFRVNIFIERLWRTLKQDR